jgi:hypothetical protein
MSSLNKDSNYDEKFSYRTGWGGEKIFNKNIWRSGTVLDCNAENRRFDPARD